MMGAAVLLLVTFLVFRLSAIRMLSDSRYEMLFSQQLLWHHSFSIERNAIPALRSGHPGQIHQHGVDLPYQLIQVGDRFYSFYPPGTPILSMPYVALANLFGISAVDRHGGHDSRGEIGIQGGLAAVLMAGLAVFVFLTSRLLVSFESSLLISAGTAFGTQVWSTASRVMWSHTWGIFLLAFIVWQIVRAEATQARLQPVLLATSLSWLYFVRPTFSSSIAAVAVYVLVYHRAIFPAFLITGCLWLGAFIAFSEIHFGQFLPAYYEGYGFHTASFWEALAGNLVSPARGLFIYVPILAFVVYLGLRYRKKLRVPLVVLAIVPIVVHLVVISGINGWHGGHCYGPRYTTDLVPWFALLAILAVEARRKSIAENTARVPSLSIVAEVTVATLLLACSITLNGVGALWSSAVKWNALPISVDEAPGRVWDWRHPQFLGVPRESTNRAP